MFYFKKGKTGWAKIAFIHTFRFMLNAITEVISKGADSDTNACIIGGMLGALHGYDKIPETMKEAIMVCDTRKYI